MEETRQALLKACREMVGRGHALGTSGNISTRTPDGSILITPTSTPYDVLTADELALVGADGEIMRAIRPPSIELTMHLALMGRQDVGAVVHTHSPMAIAAGALSGVESVPLMDVESALYLGGEILVAPFATPGSRELADLARDRIGNRAGVLLENHGAVAVGRDLDEALTAAEVLERACRVFLAVRSAGTGKALPAAYLDACCREYEAKRGLS